MTQATANPHGAATRTCDRDCARARARRSAGSGCPPSCAGGPANSLRWSRRRRAPRWQRRRARPVLAVAADTAVLWAPVVRDGSLRMVGDGEDPLVRRPGGRRAQAGRAAIDRLARGPYGGATRTPDRGGAAARRRCCASASCCRRPSRRISSRRSPTTSTGTRRSVPKTWCSTPSSWRATARSGRSRSTGPPRCARTSPRLDGWRESFGATVVAVRADSPSSGSAAVPTRLNLLPPTTRDRRRRRGCAGSSGCR